MGRVAEGNADRLNVVTRAVGEHRFSANSNFVTGNYCDLTGKIFDLTGKTFDLTAERIPAYTKTL
jgi:hypothetical protein